MNSTKYLHVYQCRPGDIVAEDVYDEYGILIIPRNSIIEKDVIKRLSTFRIRYIKVYVFEEKHEQSYGESILDTFRKGYGKNVGAVRGILDDLAAGRKLDYSKVENITGSIYKNNGDNSEIIECINKVRNIDEYTYAHSVNVSLYGMLIARWLGLPERDVKGVVQVGILHDIGKSKIPGIILNKKGPLLPIEYEKIKQHAYIGYQIVSKDMPDISSNVKDGILMHHEREDGNGYPYGLKGDSINLYAKIISVADVYDALTSERAYKKRITPFDTFMEFEKMGYGQFDTKVMITFLTNIVCYYIGAKVRMNNGEIGEIVYVAPQNKTKPIVRIGKTLIDLSENNEYKIAEMV